MDLSVVRDFKKYYFGFFFSLFFPPQKTPKIWNFADFEVFSSFFKEIKTNSPQVDLGTHPAPAPLRDSFLAKFSQLNKFGFFQYGYKNMLFYGYCGQPTNEWIAKTMSTQVIGLLKVPILMLNLPGILAN
jgi:hypothetical protein